MYLHLLSYIQSTILEFSVIPQNRQRLLRELAEHIGGQLETRRTIALNFICTHNSRRSHFGQVWAATAAAYYSINNVSTFSGGTEATAFNQRSIAALQRAGFGITLEEKAAMTSNPHYEMSFSTDSPPMICFSKTYDDAFNPSNDFVAVMTCNHADKSCPVVFGASKRFTVTYEDPKVADDTKQEVAKYDERCRQIAREMLYTFSLVSIG